MAGKQALSSFFLRSHAASHKCCLFHVGSGLFLLRVASEGPGESLHGHSWGRPPHLLGLPPGLCGQVDLCSSVRGSASSRQRAGGLGPGPVLTLRSLSSSLTMWWAPGVTSSALGLGTPWVSSLFRRPLPCDPVCDAHLGYVWRDSPRDFHSHTCALASDRWLRLPEELPMPHLRLNLSWPASVGGGQTGRSLRIRNVRLLPSGGSPENLSIVTRILIYTDLSLQPQLAGKQLLRAGAWGHEGSGIPRPSKQGCVSSEGKRHEKRPGPSPHGLC